jgi:hypothetical protein
MNDQRMINTDHMYSYDTIKNTQCVQVLLELCSLKIQDVNYFLNFTFFYIQKSLSLNQYIAGMD